MERDRFNLNLLQVITLRQYKKMKNWSKSRIWNYIAENWPTCYTVKYITKRGIYTKRDLLESLSIAEYMNEGKL